MKRRNFSLGLMGAAGLAGQLAWLAARPAVARTLATNGDWSALEAAAGGRLGLAILDVSDGHLVGHRLDERFAMCSTFKWLASAAILSRVDQGRLSLDKRSRFGPGDLVPWSPVTERRTGGDGMSLAELCEAAITVSDNTAGNLILDTLGGPGAVTDFARSLGDTVSRLDRREPDLNEARPGDPRDTTSPRAMTALLRNAVLGEALAPESRDRLRGWLEATSTNRKRLRADLPPGWRMGSKTGTGARGTTNDVGIFWPPGRAPIIASVYLTESKADEPARDGAIAAVARWLQERSVSGTGR